MRRALIVAMSAGLAAAAYAAWIGVNRRFTRIPDNGAHIVMKVDSFPMLVHNIRMTNPLMTLTSSAFREGEAIPSQYTCDAALQTGAPSGNPPLSIDHAPEGTVSFVLAMDDPDIPPPVKERLGKDAFDHWTVFNIPPGVREIVEGASLGATGKNSSGKNGYTGPCPPREYEPSEHRYVFRLYALDTTLALPTGASKEEVLAAIRGHIIAEAELVGRYRRP